QVPHLGPHLVGLLHDVAAPDGHRPARRQEIAGQDAQRRRLARAVQAQEADDLPLLDAGLDGTERSLLSVVLIELLYFDHGLLPPPICSSRVTRGAREDIPGPAPGPARKHAPIQPSSAAYSRKRVSSTRCGRPLEGLA